MTQTLFTWYPDDIPVWRARTTREFGRHFLSPGPPYPKGTAVLAVVDDPERPGLADVQLPNGDLLRFAQDDIQLVERVR